MGKCKEKKERFQVIINEKILGARIVNVLSKFSARITGERYIGEGYITKVKKITIVDRKTGKSCIRTLSPPIQLGQGETLEFSERLDRVKEAMKSS